MPTTTFADCPPLDVIACPADPASTRSSKIAICSISCVSRHRTRATSPRPALALGAAGLLEGYAVTTHWASFDNLALFGARPVQRRVVVDRNRVTAGGVTVPAVSPAGSISACCGDPERTGDRAGDPVDD